MTDSKFSLNPTSDILFGRGREIQHVPIISGQFSHSWGRSVLHSDKCFTFPMFCFFLCFKTRARQWRLESKIEAKFRIFDFCKM